MNIQELRKKGRDKLIKANVYEANIKADILLQYVLGMTKTELISNSLSEVKNSEEEKYIEYLEQIVKGKTINIHVEIWQV